MELNRIHRFVETRMDTRALMVLLLLEAGRYHDALMGSLSLIGTKWQPWFVYVCAWHSWSKGEERAALALLQDAFRLRGLCETDREFHLLESTPVIHIEFRVKADPIFDALHFATRRVWELESEEVYSSLTYFRFDEVYKLLPTCAIQGELVREFLWKNSEDEMYPFFECRRHLHSPAALRAHAEEFGFSHEVRHSRATSEAKGLAVFYYLTAADYPAALDLTEEWLVNSPSSWIAKNLRAAALHATGRRWSAQQLWLECLKVEESRALTYCMLAVACMEEGQIDNAIRYFLEGLAYDVRDQFEVRAYLKILMD